MKYILTILMLFSSIFAEDKVKDLDDFLKTQTYFQGKLPCMGCKISEILLKFDKNNKVKKSLLYFENTPISTEYNGLYEIENNIVNIFYKNGKKESYIFEDGALYILNSDGRKLNKIMNGYYKLSALTKKYMLNYYNQFFKDASSIIITPSINKNINLSFYGKDEDCKFENVSAFLKDGVLIAKNKKRQTIKIILIDESLLFVSSDDEKCIYSKIVGLYENPLPITFLITKNSIGKIAKDTKVSKILKNIPESNIEKIDKKYIVKTIFNKPLFSFFDKNGYMSNIEILNNIYKTPTQISLSSKYKDIKNQISKISINSDFISTKSENLGIIILFDKHDLDENLSLKNNAKVKKIFLD